MKKSGRVLIVAELAKEYGYKDVGGLFISLHYFLVIDMLLYNLQGVLFGEFRFSSWDVVSCSFVLYLIILVANETFKHLTNVVKKQHRSQNLSNGIVNGYDFAEMGMSSKRSTQMVAVANLNLFEIPLF